MYQGDIFHLKQSFPARIAKLKAGARRHVLLCSFAKYSSCYIEPCVLLLAEHLNWSYLEPYLPSIERESARGMVTY